MYRLILGDLFAGWPLVSCLASITMLDFSSPANIQVEIDLTLKLSIYV